MTCHEAIDVMGDAAEGRLPAALRTGFEQHVAECAPCATYFEQLCLTREALRHLPDDGGTNPRRGELMKEFRNELGPKPE